MSSTERLLHFDSTSATEKGNNNARYSNNRGSMLIQEEEEDAFREEYGGLWQRQRKAGEKGPIHDATLCLHLYLLSVVKMGPMLLKKMHCTYFVCAAVSIEEAQQITFLLLKSKKK